MIIGPALDDIFLYGISMIIGLALDDIFFL